MGRVSRAPHQHTGYECGESAGFIRNPNAAEHRALRLLRESGFRFSGAGGEYGARRRAAARPRDGLGGRRPAPAGAAGAVRTAIDVAIVRAGTHLLHSRVSALVAERRAGVDRGGPPARAVPAAAGRRHTRAQNDVGEARDTADAAAG